MTFAAKNTKDLTTPWTSWFIFGDPRSGKSTAASTFPKPLFLIPQNEGSHKTFMGQDLDYVEVLGVNQPFANGKGGMRAILMALKQLYLKDPNKFPYDTIVCDAISHYCDLVIEELGKSLKDGRQVYGELGNHLREINNTLRSMDVHTVYISLASISEGEDPKDKHGGPLIPGKSQFKLPAACETLAYCEAGTAKEPRFRMHLERYKGFIAGTRYKHMPKLIEDFSFANIEKYLTVASSAEATKPTK